MQLLTSILGQIGFSMQQEEEEEEEERSDCRTFLLFLFSPYLRFLFSFYYPTSAAPLFSFFSFSINSCLVSHFLKVSHVHVKVLCTTGCAKTKALLFHTVTKRRKVKSRVTCIAVGGAVGGYSNELRKTSVHEWRTNQRMNEWVSEAARAKAAAAPAASVCTFTNTLVRSTRWMIECIFH